MTSDLLEERQTLTQAWADYLTETMGPVTPTTANRAAKASPKRSRA